MTRQRVDRLRFAHPLHQAGHLAGIATRAHGFACAIVLYAGQGQAPAVYVPGHEIVGGTP